MKEQRLRTRASVARIAPWFALVAALSAAACPGSLENPSAFTDPLGDGSAGSAGTGGGSGGSGGSSGGGCSIPVANVPTEIFRRSCGTSACHDATSPAGELDLVSAGLESRLINQESSCNPSLLRIDRANPAASLLIDKLESEFPECGDPMPPLGTRLPEAEINCVREWVTLVLGGSNDAGTDATAD